MVALIFLAILKFLQGKLLNLEKREKKEAKMVAITMRPLYISKSTCLSN